MLERNRRYVAEAAAYFGVALGIRLGAPELPDFIASYGSDFFMAAGVYAATGATKLQGFAGRGIAAFAFAAAAEGVIDTAGLGVWDPLDFAAHATGIVAAGSGEIAIHKLRGNLEDVVNETANTQ